MSNVGFRTEGDDEVLLIEDAQETSADALRLWDFANGREMSSSEREVGRKSENGGTGAKLGLVRIAGERLQAASKYLSERGSIGGGGRGL